MDAAEIRLVTGKTLKTLDKAKQYRERARSLEATDPVRAQQFPAVAEALESDADEWADVALKLSKG